MDTTLIPLQLFLYRQLLVVYPPDLRARFANDMLEIFEDLLRESHAQRGFSGAISVWANAGRELLTVAIPLRLQNTRWAAAAVSLLVSSFIAWIFFRSVG
jgi:hypothetical protein